jgi:hypothetical protein
MASPQSCHVPEPLEKAFGCRKGQRYGLGEGPLQIVGSGPLGLVRLAAGGLLLAAPVLEQVTMNWQTRMPVCGAKDMRGSPVAVISRAPVSVVRSQATLAW